MKGETHVRNWRLRVLLLVTVVSLFGLGFFLGQSHARAQEIVKPDYSYSIPKEWGSLKAIEARQNVTYMYFEDASGTIRSYVPGPGEAQTRVYMEIRRN